MRENGGETGESGAERWGVVVVNWNTPELTIDCLESLLAAAGAPRQVVVVDNASTDGSVARLETWARDRGVGCRTVDPDEAADAGGDAWLLIFASRRVRGFSANNNLGLRYFRDHTRASHVLLLNNDATVAADFFTELARAVASRPQGGLFTGTIYQDPERDVVWYAGGRINAWRALVTHQTVRPPSSDPIETPFVCGCAMLIARPVIERAGLLPECFDPIYCEDADYSLRARAAGFELIYAPSAVVYHKVGGTVGEASVSPRVTFSTNRNRAYLIRRNYGGWRKAAGLGYLLVTKPGRALVETIRGRPRIGWAILKGVAVGVTSRRAWGT